MNEDQTNRMIDILNDILRWTKFQGMIRLKEVILTNVKSENERLIYELSDGRSTTDIAKETGVSYVTVYNYWQRWSKTGIVVPSKKYKGRCERMVSLLDIGIEVPKIKPKIEQPKETPDISKELLSNTDSVGGG